MSGNSQIEVKYPIMEIFTSIQGEGVNLGKPANFIRFAGCNLNCEWCDTEWKHAKEHLDIDAILSQLDPKVSLVVLTGGEPTIQKDLMKLVQELLDRHYEVAMETNGTRPTKEYWEKGVHVSCSPKPATLWRIDDQCFYDELKYVVDEEFDLMYMRAEEDVTIWLQPEGGNMQKSWKKALEIQRQYLARWHDADIRVGVQLHKIMEVR